MASSSFALTIINNSKQQTTTATAQSIFNFPFDHFFFSTQITYTK